MVSEDVKAYVSSLADLTFNSKPLINMLTMLADENVAHAPEIVEVVENHLAKVKTDVKLPILYLIDCIVKNVGGPYTELFSHNIVATFCSVFRVVDEKTRAEMFKLRQTWNDVFSAKKLYAIDVQISLLDPAWPVTAPLPPSSSIHLNPKFLKSSTNSPSQGKTQSVPVTSSSGNADPVTLDMQQQLIQKQKELIELQQKKVELELLQTKVRLREQISGGNLPNASQVPQMLKNQRMQMPPSGIPRIQPVNSALVAAATGNQRPIRDPRLLRQQQQQLINQQQQQHNNQKTQNISNVVVQSDGGAHKTKIDPRLMKNGNNNDSTMGSSAQTKRQPRLSPKSSRSDKGREGGGSSGGGGNGTKLSSKSLTDSPTKRSKVEKSSPKGRRKESPPSPVETTKPQQQQFKTRGVTGEPKISKSDTSLPIFKDAKSAKGRSFTRRIRSPQFSPEPLAQDVDLRLSGRQQEKQLAQQQQRPVVVAAPASPEKITPKPITKQPSSPSKPQPMDVDLRQLPAVITKKRTSTDSPEQTTSKKSKSEIFHVLFGNEDTDLRKLSAPTPPITLDRPPTPPPPIISSSESIIEEEKEEPQPQKPSLEAVRAKLAANLKKSCPTSKKKSDHDLRTNQVSSSTDITNKIIISKDDDDKIKGGEMTTIQQKKLMNKIIAQIEAQKLMQAKQKNNEEDSPIEIISLTPISDEELDGEANEDLSRHDRDSPVLMSSFGDKDERILPPMHMMQQQQQQHSEDGFPNRYGRDNRRGVPNWRGGRGRRHWDAGPHPRPPLRPWMQQQQPMNNQNWQQGNFRPQFPHHDMDQNERRSPDGDVLVEAVGQEDIKTITIDGSPRDIRYYDEAAIIFMNWDDPREISFQDGARRVIFNDVDMYMMNFNEPYREYRIGDTTHQVRLGGPSREIYIDYKPYECYFGGPGITIDLDGKVTSVKLDGPPPQVKIGDCRTDLVAGKIKLIIDAKTIIPVFLDARLQTFVFNGEQHSVQFEPGLKGVLLNGEHFDVQFGGLPKPVMLKDKRHYIRFSVLPKGIRPGRVNIKGLGGEDNMSVSSPRLEEAVDFNEPALPIPQRLIKAYDPSMSPDNSSSGSLFQNVLQQQNLHNLDLLTNEMSASDQHPSNVTSYQLETNQTSSQQPVTAPNPAANLFNMGSINDLFQKLVASGMVTTSSSSSLTNNKDTPPRIATPPQKEQQQQRPYHHRPHGVGGGSVRTKKFPPLRHVSFAKPEQLKVRQGALYEKLYNGMQCSSCGMRFPPEQSMHYSQHLDWHFRQNRKGKKNARVASSRKWYYSTSDWANYEEIENLDEREKNFFDQQQQQQAEGAAEASTENAELPSVTADPELQDICEICGDKFDIFFNEDKEEWQFKNAIRSEDKTYHPICYEEFQQTLLNATVEEVIPEKIGQIPGIEIVLDDDDEDKRDAEKHDEIVDHVILDDESDESKQQQPGVDDGDKSNDEHPPDDAPSPTSSFSPNGPPPVDDYVDEDDDVIIKEETIEQIVLDDDDDKMEDDDDDDVVGDFDDDGDNNDVVESGSAEGSTKSSVAAPVVETIDDGFMDVSEGLRMLQNGVKVKTEPMDEDDLPNDDNLFDTSMTYEQDTTPEVAEEEPKEPELEAPHSAFVASIDGNMEIDASAPAQAPSVSGKIKINIHKPLPVIPAKDSFNNKDMFSESDNLPETVIDPSQPLPPGEEPILLKLKPALQGVELKKMAPVQKGTELTGMCSIM